MNKTNKNIILSVETGILGGSLCILEGSKEIAVWEGKREVSKSEDVLQAIAMLFKANSIKKERIAQIIVSDKPGSLTGLRIGRSIALGLRNAFDADLKEVCLLEEMAKLSEVKNNVLTVVPVGRNSLAWMTFEKEGKSGLLNGDLEALKKDFVKMKIEYVVAHRDIINMLREKLAGNIFDANQNMARHLTYNASDNESFVT